MKKAVILVVLLIPVLLFVACNQTQGPLTPSPAMPPTTTTQQPSFSTPAPEPSPQPAPAPVIRQGELKVHFIDVGQGDSILIDLSDIEVLIDGGEKTPGVVNYIKNYIDGPLEVMVATHTDADHIGGLIDVLAKYQVKDIWLNGDTATSATYSQFISSVNSEGTTIHQAELGNTIEVGNLKFNVLNPSKPLFSDANNNSIILSLKYGDIDFLFMGDAEREAEAKMLAQSVVSIPDCDVLKVGHHGSRTASSPEFLNRVKPKIAIYMAGIGNKYGHPHQETIQALSAIGAKIYGTDIHGNIIITTDGKIYSLQLQKQAPPVTVTPTPAPTSTTTPTLTPSPSSPPSTSTNVKITKIFYNGLVPRTESDEYVEMANLGSEPVDLKGWVLKDVSDGRPSFTFPSYVLQPGNSIRVYTNEIHAEYGGFSFGSGTAVWNNSNPDTAALYNAQGQEVSRKSY